jgi:hypothetical protein
MPSPSRKFTITVIGVLAVVGLQLAGKLDATSAAALTTLTGAYLGANVYQKGLTS